MKAILVLKEMPSECIECPFHQIYADSNLTETHCILTAERNEDGVNTRADWCPLKPMPQKKVVTVKRIEDIQSYSITEVADKISAKIILKTNEVFALGWNACLDSIIGENNESNISD